MIILEIIGMAFRSLMTNRLRSFLSMLGIIIGVAAIIAVISISNGAQKQVLDQINSLGTNIINITPRISRGSGGKISQETTNVFTYEMATQMKEFCPNVEKATAFIDGQGLATYNNLNLQVRIRATTNEFFEIVGLRLARGRLFSESDLQGNQMVAILGSEVAKDLFNEGNPIGQKLKLVRGNLEFTLMIIGLLEEKGEMMFSNYDRQIFVPITTWMNRIQNIKYVNGFIAQASSNEEAAAAVAQIEYLLYQKLNDLEKFNVSSQSQMLSMASNVTNTFTLLLGGIASIALLVGGIGIMNITLVSVTERTKEIGIRKALGAKRRTILFQFLIEACTLSVLGGVVGVGVGIIVAMSISRIGGWPFLVTSSAIFIALSFSTFIGLFFGIYPASKAASMNPVDALNYE